MYVLIRRSFIVFLNTFLDTEFLSSKFKLFQSLHPEYLIDFNPYVVVLGIGSSKLLFLLAAVLRVLYGYF